MRLTVDCKPRAAARGATGAAVSAVPLALCPLALVCAAAAAGRRPRTAAAAAPTTGSAGGSGAPSSAQRSAAVADVARGHARTRSAPAAAAPGAVAAAAGAPPSRARASGASARPQRLSGPGAVPRVAPDQRASLDAAEPVNPAPLPPTVSVAPPAERCDAGVQCDLLPTCAPAARRAETSDAACGGDEAELSELSELPELPICELRTAATASAASATALALLVATGAEAAPCPTAALAAATAAASTVEAEMAGGRQGLLDESQTHRLDGACVEGVQQATSIERPRGGSSIAAAAAAAATAKALAEFLPLSDGTEKDEGDALSAPAVSGWTTALRPHAEAIIPIAAAAAAAAWSAVRGAQVHNRVAPLSDLSGAVADVTNTPAGPRAEAAREPQPELQVGDAVTQDCEPPCSAEKQSGAPSVGTPSEGEWKSEVGASIGCPCAEARKPVESSSAVQFASEDLVLALPDDVQVASSAVSTALDAMDAHGGVASSVAGDVPLAQPQPQPMPARVGGVLRSKRLKAAVNAVALVLAQRPRVGGVLRSKRWKIAEAAALETAFRQSGIATRAEASPRPTHVCH
eukprot:m51a1_g2904 hypothetical protein (579) ;mRNA; f:479150-482750